MNLENLNFNIYNVIIFSGIIQGLLFSFVVLLNKKYKSQTNNYIVYTVLALSFSNFQYWVDDVNLNGIFSVFIDLRIPCDMLIVPFFYLFVNSYLYNKNRRKIIYLLLIPFTLSLLFNIILYKKLFFKDYIFRNINILLESLSLILSLIVIIIIIFKLKNYKKHTKVYKRTEVKAETKWIKQILYIGSFMCLFWLLTIIVMQTKYNNGLNIYYPLWLSISALVYWISYVGIINSRINTDRKKIRNFINSQIETESKNNTIKKKNIKLYIEITDWITDHKKYLNPNLNLEFITKEFNISNGYLSQILSSNNELNFNDYINNLRIDHAKEIFAK